MNLKHIAIAALITIVVSAAWRYRAALPFASMFESEKPKPTPIQFDNGTVRQPPARSSEPTQAAAPAPQGPRKCIQGGKVVYTDRECPTGSKEGKVRQDLVTVVPGQAPAAPAPSLPGLPNVRDGLRPQGPSLQEQAIERATR